MEMGTLRERERERERELFFKMILLEIKITRISLFQGYSYQH